MGVLIEMIPSLDIIQISHLFFTLMGYVSEVQGFLHQDPPTNWVLFKNKWKRKLQDVANYMIYEESLQTNHSSSDWT